MRILFVMILFIITACGNGNNSSKSYDESRELIPDPEGHQKDTFTSDTLSSSSKKDSTKHVKEKK